MTYFLGIDLGTSAVKCILVDAQGQVMASHSVEYPLQQPHPGWAEQQPEVWWRSTANGVRQLINHANIRGDQVVGIGLSGQMHGSVFLDAQLNVVRPALLWCDQRTEEECQEIEHVIGASQLAKWTGNKALTGFTAPKILWVRKHEPEHYARIRHLMLPKDYVRLKLTGEFAMDVADASGTLLLNVAERKWSDEVLEKLDIPREWLPPLLESNDIAGRLRMDAAEQMGLHANIPVVAGGGDQACGAVGVGVVQRGIASVALGTSGVVFVHDDHYQGDEQARLHSFCHGVPGKWHRMGVMLSAGGAFQWWKQQFAQYEQQIAEQKGQETYELLTAMANTAPAGSEGLLFLPYLTGERTPHPDPKARGAFVGLNLRHTKAHLTRAVLEGITYGLRDSLELMKLSDVCVKELRVNGGGAKSKMWRQLIADIFGYPVVVVNSTDGPAYGAAVMAASAVLNTSIPELCKQWIRPVDRTEPDGSQQRIYEEYYAVYQTLYSSLQPASHRLTQLAMKNN